MVRIVALGGLAAAEGTAAIPALVAEIESKDLKAPGRGDPFARRNSRPRSDRRHGEGVSEAPAASAR